MDDPNTAQAKGPDLIADLQTAVTKVLSELPGDMCQKYVASMMGRMQKVVSGGGAQIDN